MGLFRSASFRLTVFYVLIVMVISVSDDENLVKGISVKELPANWKTLAAYAILQAIGSAWYESHETLLLTVPSVIVPHEFNFVINTEHRGFNKNVKLARVENYFFDDRLL